MKTIYKLHSFFEDPQPQKRLCDESGCTEEGVYKAPQSPKQLYLYYWFCLKHVQMYNSQWNYYRGMDEDEIEEDYRSDTTWQRPTWRFGGSSSKSSFFIKDPFDLLNTNKGKNNTQQRDSSWFPPQTEEAKALELMELKWPLTKEKLKQRYIQLVKQHHPDVNGGCFATEEKLKLINRAHEVLKKIVQ